MRIRSGPSSPLGADGWLVPAASSRGSTSCEGGGSSSATSGADGEAVAAASVFVPSGKTGTNCGGGALAGAGVAETAGGTSAVTRRSRGGSERLSGIKRGPESGSLASIALVCCTSCCAPSETATRATNRPGLLGSQMMLPDRRPAEGSISTSLGWQLCRVPSGDSLQAEYRKLAGSRFASAAEILPTIV